MSEMKEKEGMQRELRRRRETDVTLSTQKRGRAMGFGGGGE